MATEDAVGSDRESQAEVDAVLAETGRTMDQVRRWRREGLLPDVVQDQQAYRGSVVLYPKGTCAQIRAASALFKQKNRVDYVGLRLWRLGFPVDEKHWRPRLQQQGRMLDRVFPLLMRLVREIRSRLSKTKLSTTMRRSDWSRSTTSSFPGSKVEFDSQEMPTVLRVIGDVGTGEFDGFEASIAGEEQTSDEALTIRAFDLTKAGSDSILGKQLNLIELLPSGLKNVSAAISMGNFEHVANAPAEEIARARDDAKNSLAIALYLYEANRWIYGDGAFGLRLAAWIARKAPDVLVDTTTLLMFRLRQVPAPFCRRTRSLKWRSKLAKSGSIQRGMSGTGATIPASRKSFIPKRIKSAFADEIALKRWQSELNAIIVQATAKTPMGSNDDGQEVGKSH